MIIWFSHWESQLFGLRISGSEKIEYYPSKIFIKVFVEVIQDFDLNKKTEILIHIYYHLLKFGFFSFNEILYIFQT